MTTLLLAIVSHTPLWVWVLLVALIVLGARQWRTHDVSPARLWLQPVAIGAFSLFGAWNAFGAAAGAVALGGWAIGLGAGVAVNRWLRLPRGVRANPDGSFRVDGSPAPLALLLGVFAIRYATAVALALSPGLAHQVPLALVLSIVFGLPAGLLLARSRRIWSMRAATATLRAA